MESTASKLLPGKESEILEIWIGQQLKDEGLREDLMNGKDLRNESHELLKAILNVIKKGDFTDRYAAEFEKVNEVLEGISLNRAAHGFSPGETAHFIFSLRDTFTAIMQKNISSAKILYKEINKINKLIDILALISMESFLRGREDVILRQTSEITEISTPVIQIWDGILAMPLIGTLDSARTQVVMESLLLKIVETGSTIAILDISGVPTVDSLVAQHLMKTVSATRLMGAECIISGIRPEIAQTIVHLGIDLSNINTKSSLAQALREAFVINRLEVHDISNPLKSIPR
jgi:rsbT co-antagonist protein RsbR